MSEMNPYQPPESRVADIAAPSAGNFILEGRSVDAGRGWNWITEGFALFKRQPGTWILIMIVGFAVLIALSLIPLVGLFAGLLFQVFAGGLMLGCKAMDDGEEVTVGHLFAGFKSHTGNLVIVGVLVGVLSLIIVVPVMLIAMGPSTLAMIGGGKPDPAIFGITFLLAMLVILALLLPVWMAMWFAPPLVVLNDLSPTEAMKTSFRGCLKNIVPFLVFSVLAFVLYLAAIIPLGLGLLVYFPVMIIAVYTAYRDVFYAA